MIKVTTKKIIEVGDWDNLVEQVYGRPYSYQQQDGCKERGNHYICVPAKNPEDYRNTTVPEVVNHDEMGVSFEAWLARDPKQKLSTKDDQNTWSLQLWWERNFYPHVDMLINDLHKIGEIEEGEYTIEIDW